MFVLQAEGIAAVFDELIELLEGTGVQEDIDSLTGGEFAGVVLPAKPFLAASLLRGFISFVEVS